MSLGGIFISFTYERQQKGRNRQQKGRKCQPRKLRVNEGESVNKGKW